MTTWRDRTSVLAQDDLDQLLDTALHEAADLLASNGAFAPFSVAISSAGDTQFVASPGDASGDAAVAKEWLFTALRSTKAGLRAAAVVTDVRLASGQDAIDFHLEHAEGPTLLVRAPYVQKAGALTVEDRSAYSEPPRIWSA